MQTLSWVSLSIIAIGFAVLPACSDSSDEDDVATRQTASPVTAEPGEDIWDVCARVETLGDWLTDPPLEKTGYVFRCFQGQALQCQTGATGGASMKFTEEEPPDLAKYCREHPDDEDPPLDIVGDGPPIKIWRCAQGQPVGLANTAFNPAEYDELGFYISPSSPVPTPGP